MKNEVSRVTTKGRIVIPSKLRRKFGIREGRQVAFVEEEQRLVLQPLTPEFIHSLRGSLKGDLLRLSCCSKTASETVNYETSSPGRKCRNVLRYDDPVYVHVRDDFKTIDNGEE